MAESVATTFLGPQVSFKTTESTPATTPHMDIPSGMSVTVGGICAFTGAESHAGAQTITGTIVSSSTNTFSAKNYFTGLVTTTGGITNGTSAVTNSAALVQSGGATFSGGVTINSALTLGTAGVPFAALRKSTASVALGAVGLDSVTTSVTINEVAAGDIILRIVPASIWSGAYYDIGLEGIASANSTVLVVARDSAATAINTAAMNMDFYWLDLA